VVDSAVNNSSSAAVTAAAVVVASNATTALRPNKSIKSTIPPKASPSNEGGDFGYARIADPHVPYVINVAAFAAYLEFCGTACKSYLHSRCTRKGPLPISLYHQFLATRHSYLVQFVPPAFAFTLRLPVGSKKVSLEMDSFLLHLMGPKFVYIDSHGGVEDDPTFVAFVKRYLRTSFPTKASWEL
jgi:hypothetical protein